MLLDLLPKYWTSYENAGKRWIKQKTSRLIETCWTLSNIYNIWTWRASASRGISV